MTAHHPHSNSHNQDYPERVDTTPSASSRKDPAPSRSNDKGRRFSSVILGMAVIIVAGVGVFYFMDRNGIAFKSNISSVEFLGTVSSAELEMHDTPDDCWLAIHGNAFDLTEYAPTHPGGPEFITDFCGMDATRDYDREHSESLLKTIDFLRLGVYTEEQGGRKEPGRGGAGAPSPARIPASSPYVSCSSDDEDDEEEEGGCKRPASGQQIRPAPAPVPAPQRTPTQPQGSMCRQQFYTANDVAQHAVREDCWYILYGVVYDLTNYIDIHPGGARRVFRECGTDATAAYETEHQERLLVSEGMGRYVIGQLGSQSGLQNVPC